jgi:hypothetical protein
MRSTTTPGLTWHYDCPVDVSAGEFALHAPALLSVAVSGGYGCKAEIELRPRVSAGGV